MPGLDGEADLRLEGEGDGPLEGPRAFFRSAEVAPVSLRTASMTLTPIMAGVKPSRKSPLGLEAISS